MVVEPLALVVAAVFAQGDAGGAAGAPSASHAVMVARRRGIVAR